MPFIEIPAQPLEGGRIQSPMRVYVEPTQAERDAARAANQITETELRRTYNLTDDATFAYAQRMPDFPPVVGQRRRSGRLEMALHPTDHVRTENMYELDRSEQWRRAVLAFSARLAR